MALKYQAELQLCPDQPCPSSRYASSERVGYRFMRSPARVPEDFKPPALMPHRPRQASCGSYALSFNDTLEAARRKYQSFVERFGAVGAASRYGDHIGFIQLCTADGVHGPSSHGHFDLHEDESCDWTGRVVELHPALDAKADS